MNWHRNILIKYRTEITQSATISFAISIIYLLYRFSAGYSFAWHEINPIEQPSIFIRAFYSALAFFLPGAFLYTIGFYKFLHDVIVKEFGSWGLYNLIKSIVWILLMILMYLVFKLTVDILNAIISFFYNIFAFVIFLSPAISIFIILFLIGVYVIKKINTPEIKPKTQKRHHTVPRCYLQKFSDKQGFVWVLDTKDNIFKIRPENILVENNFYKVTLKNDEKSLFVENTLANIESDYAAIFENKISKDQFLTHDERAKVSVFIAALMLRTKPRRESMRNMFQKLKGSMEGWKKQFEMNPKARKFASAVPSSGETINLNDVEKYLENLEEEHSVSILTNLPETAQLIFNMKWSVWKNSDIGFVTSDDPVVLLRPASIKKYGPKAIGSLPGLIYKDVELTLPLSRNRLLLAGWILERDSYLSVDNEVAQNINYRTITRSSERVIADSKEKIDAIRLKYNETIHKQTSTEESKK